MAGMDRNTGKPLDGFDHLVQSLGDILSTPLLTRVYRREYGSEAFYLQDKPTLEETLLDFVIAFGSAVDKWEPRYRLQRMWFNEAGQDGRSIIGMNGVYYPRGHLGDFTTGVKRGVDLPLPTGFYVSGNPFAAYHQ